MRRPLRRLKAIAGIQARDESSLWTRAPEVEM